MVGFVKEEVCLRGETHLADVMDEEVTFLTEDHGGIDILLGEQVKPHGKAVHHGQEEHAEEFQDVQNPLHYITAFD